MIQEPPMQAGI